MADLGTAYVHIVPSAQGISGSISGILGPEGESAGQDAGKRINKGLGGGLSRAASSVVGTIGGAFTSVAATGSAALAGMTASITNSAIKGGIARAVGIDEAQAKFRQLGMDVDKTMSSVMDSVANTRYASNDMAAVAVNLGSAGVESGEAMTNALKSVASVASISGKDLSDIGAIYTKVASSGKVTGDVIQQLSLNGINANAALAQAMGKTTDEISAMVSAGEIDMNTFATAMSTYFGDAADSANSTFSGALTNVQARINQIGQAFMSPVLNNLQQVFAGTEGEANGLLDALNLIKDALQPMVDQWTQLVDVMGGKLSSAVSTFVTSMNNGEGLLTSFKNAIIDLIPDSLKQKFDELSPSMQNIILALLKAGGIIGGIASGWGVLTGAIGTLVPGLGSLLGPLAGAGGMFKVISTVGSNLVGMFQAMIPGVSGTVGPIGTLASKLGTLAGPVGWAVAAFGLLMARSEPFRNAIINLVKVLGGGLMSIMNQLKPLIGVIIKTVMVLAKDIGDALAPIIQALMPILQTIISTVQRILAVVIPIVQEILSVVTSVIQALLPVVTPILTKMLSIFSTVFSAISKVVGVVMGAIQKYVLPVVKKISGAFEGIKSVVSKVTTTFKNIKDAMWKPIDSAKQKIDGIIKKIKGWFPFKLGNFLKGIKVPKIELKMKEKSVFGKTIKYPTGFDIKWNAQAMDQPYLFSGATVFGAGEAGDEVLYGRSALMRDIASAVQGQGQTINIYSTVDGAEDPEAYADRLVRRLKVEMRTV